MVPESFKTNLPIIFTILLVRISSIFLIRTSFVPDEYWQSIEVAHNMAFGYGYLTWEWKKKIRNCIYPFMFHVLLKLLPDSPEMLILLPKVSQTILSAVGDFFIYKLSTKLFGCKCGQWTLFNLLSSWFLFYCSSRTLTNMAETSFTACGMYFYPWKKKHSQRLACKYMWFAGASVLMRPTAIVVWLPLYCYHIWRENQFTHLLKNTILIGSVIFSLLMISDRWFYGDWVVTPYQFFLFNWSNNIGAFYGEHSFLWYFYAGWPVLLGIHIIPFIMGTSLNQLHIFYFLMIWVIFVFSLLSHKEFRFLLPILPLAMVICGSVMNEISLGRMRILKYKVNSKFNIFLVSVILAINIPFSLYMGLFHQRGTIEATQHLSHSISKNSSVLFLMPCHSTPYYSYIHQNIAMRFLTCEPNFNSSKNYIEEADDFFQNPNLWLYDNYANSQKILPSHIVMFNTLYPQVTDFLKKYSYHLCYRTFHSHFSEPRTGTYVHIYCK